MLKCAHERGLTLDHELRLIDVPEEGLRFEENLPSDWLDAQLAEGLPPEAAPHTSGAVHVHLEVRPLGPVATLPPLELKGRVEADILATCVRCLADVPIHVEASLDSTLLATATSSGTARPGHRPPNGDGPSADDASPSGDEEDSTYDPRALELMPRIREALLLEVPVNPVCDDGPACDERTATLIREANRPADDAMPNEDPRWDALRGLRGPKID